MREAQSAAMTNPHKGRTGLDRAIRAAGYSIAGLRGAYHGESAVRQEFWLAVVLLPLAFWLGRGWVEVALLAGSVMLVLIVELLNSGIEAAIDRVSFEIHDLSKRAKDLASAAVLLSLLLCGGIWLAALWQRFVS
jgi:diacylglycerol kinase (ATP)